MHHQKSQPTRPVAEKSSRRAQVSINPVFLLFWLISAASQLQDFKSCHSLQASRIDCTDDIWAGLYVAPFPILYYGLQEPPYATLKRPITAAIRVRATPKQLVSAVQYVIGPVRVVITMVQHLRQFNNCLLICLIWTIVICMWDLSINHHTSSGWSDQINHRYPHFQHRHWPTLSSANAVHLPLKL
jgi:hypothetical protein